MELLPINSFMTDPYHIETSPLICLAKASSITFNIGNITENVTTAKNLLWILKVYLGPYQVFFFAFFTKKVDHRCLIGSNACLDFLIFPD